MANIYVNHTGSSTPPYDTEAKAARNIQVALDAAVSGDTVLIKADQDYVMNGTDQQAAQFDVDVNNNVTIKGYYSTIGDQDYGGTYYKDPDHGWAVIDANNGAFHIFSAGNKENLRWSNFKTINVNTNQYCFDLTPTAAQKGYMLQNCWTTGGRRAIQVDYLQSVIVIDCKFSGTYGTGLTDGVIVMAANNLGEISLLSNEFSHGNAKRTITMTSARIIALNNVINVNGTVSVGVFDLDSGWGGVIANNTIYENTGGNIANGIKLSFSNLINSAVFNNIIIGCTTGINDSVGINFGGWNCFHNNGSNWTLRNGDIVADPQFMNAPNGDFRLKPTSPCLNTGKPILGSGYADIGAWQRKSLLR
jgi:hypothetical protein